MKKDFNKISMRTIMTYFVIVSVICLLRIWGVNQFQMGYDNAVINFFSGFITKHNLETIWYSITLYFYTYMILSISCKDNTRRMKIYTLIITAIAIPYKMLMVHVKIPVVRSILEISFLILPCIIYTRKIKETFKDSVTFLMLNTLFQYTILICKNVKYFQNKTFLVNIMLDIDYILILLLFYYYFFNREEVINLWTMVAGLFLDLWHGFMRLPGSFLESLKRLIYGAKKQANTIKKVLQSKKQEKASNIAFITIYYLLTLFWNIFTIVLIIFVANLNNMAITIVFVLFSFLINKGKFGKPLHLKSAFYCFIISNISYYFISRLTLPIGTSYLVPILIGVLMSYFTALIVKYTTNDLYKGMKEEEIRELCKIKGMDQYKTEFLVDFYSKEMNYVQLHIKYRYSIDRLRHMKMEYMKEFKNS